MKPKGIVLSPGPGKPEDAGICMEVIRHFYKNVPILGICLGHQAIISAFGGDIVRAERIKHGKTSRVKHNGTSIFFVCDTTANSDALPFSCCSTKQACHSVLTY